MKILVSDNLSEKGIEILKKAGLEVDVKTGMKPDELKACIKDYHGLIIRSATRVTEDIINSAVNLKVIGRAGSGLDNVDKVAATKKGIVVMNTPGGNTITTAEHTIGLIFSVARMIPQADMSMKQGLWEKKKFLGVELYNKTIGIIGIGNIGSQVAKRCIALGMNVIAYDPFLSDEKASEIGIKKVSLEELFKNSDFITIHTPLTPETRNLINKNTIAMMKDGVRIINCARGGIVNEKDLYEALESGKVAGAGLDVFENEPPGDNPLVRHERVVCTPHLGASTHEAQENVALAIAEQVVDYLVHGIIRHAVNFPSIPQDQIPVLKPYIDLAERMGIFASHLLEGGITEITVEYRGEVSNLNNAPITIAAIKGILTPLLQETVNFVNAPLIARERGIDIKETKAKEAGDYSNLVTLRVKTSTGELNVSGTLFSRKSPRIVQIDKFPVEIIPDGIMLMIYNHDRPGVIGNIGTLLGKNNINIGRMHFGRESEGGLAISVVNVDSEIPETLLEEIKALPNIISARLINIRI